MINGTLTIGSVVALSAYLANLYGPMSALTNARVEFATSLVSFERVFEVLDMPHEIEEMSTPYRPTEVKGEIELDGVWFSDGGASGLESVRRYGWRGMTEGEDPSARTESETWALQDLNLRVAPGELAALVGPSGAGKTTTTYLVPRLYDVDRGRVLIDGRDVREFELEALASAVGVVTQESYLFHDTIAANLR